MASGITNEGAQILLGRAVGEVSVPASDYVHLCTIATAPTVDSDDTTGLTNASNYTYSTITNDGSEVDVNDSDNTDNWGRIQYTDQVITASGGELQAAYALLSPDSTFATPAPLIAFWDLGGTKTVSNGQTLTLQDLELRVDNG